MNQNLKVEHPIPLEVCIRSKLQHMRRERSEKLKTRNVSPFCRTLGASFAHAFIINDLFCPLHTLLLRSRLQADSGRGRCSSDSCTSGAGGGLLCAHLGVNLI